MQKKSNSNNRKHYHVKKDDLIEVISGKWKGEHGKILAVLRRKDRVVLEMTGLSPEKQRQIGRRSVRKTSGGKPGGLVERAVSVHVSNVRKKSAEKSAESAS